ncbi:Predicted flavoprotein CzcO associated with the cation diffusion facilitator CzcD [Mycobacterium numidiamassiliense]|uniref:Predicted flavoprotein CzcO associated with the cation diffusion facilitator CzcD n=1 Tax=Mycobacterium numidiamassiliense TaxID=1841861 RepID=A0A2U3PDI2_9MYCO|nr:Predicted flavoprotein CzcO associated with the cation diffusion facilitator CzcD [Mycobacterium numidiamassiliense]
MPTYAWTVIGAGPAGIAAVGRLLDHGIAAEKIAWIDPAFAVGDLGQKWRSVSSNTIAETFLGFLNASAAFRFAEAPPTPLQEVDPEDTCALDLVADPLVWVTQQLRERVHVVQATATSLSLHQRQWRIDTEHREVFSDNVILAVGAVPKSLSYPHLDEIPVEVALDPEKLAAQSLDGATVAVFGSSHSSMIALPNLLRQPVEKVINFYRTPLKYAVYLDGWILFDDTGLKGHAAAWARENIDGKHPDRLERCWVSSPEFQEKLEACDRVVYTVGFERRQLPATPQWGELEYNQQNGIIAPGLFGLGIAFPEYAEDRYGFGEHRVGLKKFMDYLNSVLPLWLHYGT